MRILNSSKCSVMYSCRFSKFAVVNCHARGGGPNNTSGCRCRTGQTGALSGVEVFFFFRRGFRFFLSLLVLVGVLVLFGLFSISAFHRRFPRSSGELGAVSSLELSLRGIEPEVWSEVSSSVSGVDGSSSVNGAVNMVQCELVDSSSSRIFSALSIACKTVARRCCR